MTIVHHTSILFVGVCLAFGQLIAQVQMNAGAELLADGAVNPEKIPDDLALKVLFVSLASDPPDNRNMFSVKTSRLGFSAQDSVALQRSVQSFRSAFSGYQAALKAIKPANNSEARARGIQAVLDIDRQIMALVAQTHLSLRDALSQSGRTKFDNHIAHIKTRIRLVGPPKM